MIHVKAQKKADYGELLARPHYEAVITDLAHMYGMQPTKLRRLMRRKLQIFKIIKESTTEFSEDQLKDLANKLSAFYFRQCEKEDGELDALELNKIIFNSTL